MNDDINLPPMPKPEQEWDEDAHMFVPSTRYTSDQMRAYVLADRATRAPQQAEPEIVQRVTSYAGQTMRTARSPNITARECIDLANWIVALNAPQQAEPQQGEPGKEEA